MWTANGEERDHCVRQAESALVDQSCFGADEIHFKLAILPLLHNY